MPKGIVLTAINGPYAGKEARLSAGAVARVGRSMRADFFLPDDKFMSGAHFLLEFDQKGWLIRDLNSSNGTMVNGTRIDVAVLRDKDNITAGQTTFSVHIEGAEAGPPAKPAAPLRPKERLLAMLRGEFQPLYGILDAAREPDVFKLLVESKQEIEKRQKEKQAQAGKKTGSKGVHKPAQAAEEEEAQSESLFEGQPKSQLAHFAPYLVRLPPHSPLLAKLVHKGWGKSWGVFLTCAAPFKDVRRHLRHFLMVNDESGRQLYFRFYDPRVLRIYIPTCTAEEVNQFFGPITSYLVEDEKPDTLLQFEKIGTRAGKKTLSLLPPH